jgi:HEAT repeat protein
MFINALLVVLVMLGSAAQQPPSAPAPAPPQGAGKSAVVPGATSVEEATEITNGWALLAQGMPAQAAARARSVLEQYPHSGAALNLAVEAEISRMGAGAGLEMYEKWLGQRALEEPSILRRIADAILREHIYGTKDERVRLEALRALAADGDQGAVAALSKDPTGNGPRTRMLAALGNERAVQAIAANLSKGTGNDVAAVQALGESGSRSAVAPLTASLKDRNPEVRGAAATGLGKLGTKYDVLESLKAALTDPTAYVRVKAAGALYGLGDLSGMQTLQELSASDAAVSRLMAAQAMAGRPDARWLDAVRTLTSATEPEVRVGAATLLSPHDPEAARKVLEAAMNDPNPAIREMAGESMIDVTTTDLRALRQFLRSSKALEQVQAAGQILTVLR